jgi:hypothetical protein
VNATRPESGGFPAVRSHPVKFFVYVLAVVLALLGILFLIAAGQGNAVVRMAIGVVLLAAVGGLVALVQLKPLQTTHVHQMKLDLPGDTSVEQMTCQQCGAQLSSESVSVAAGAVLVHCEYCGAQYQLEEAPKW